MTWVLEVASLNTEIRAIKWPLFVPNIAKHCLNRCNSIHTMLHIQQFPLVIRQKEKHTRQAASLLLILLWQHVSASNFYHSYFWMSMTGLPLSWARDLKTRIGRNIQKILSKYWELFGFLAHLKPKKFEYTFWQKSSFKGVFYAVLQKYPTSTSAGQNLKLS